jgi:hypothetical protein
MIRSEREYREALDRLKQDEEVIDLQRQKLSEHSLTEEEVNRALGPVLSFRDQLREEVEWYERARRRDFEVSVDVRDIGRTLIALRIANGLSQKELADKLGVSEAQVSRDERNEYHGIKLETTSTSVVRSRKYWVGVPYRGSALFYSGSRPYNHRSPAADAQAIGGTPRDRPRPIQPVSVLCDSPVAGANNGSEHKRGGGIGVVLCRDIHASLESATQDYTGRGGASGCFGSSESLAYSLSCFPSL